MPHSSGGGSHGGGSFSSSSSSSSSSSDSSSYRHIKNTNFEGAVKYVYYENYHPVYVYADYDIRKQTEKGKVLSIIDSAVTLLFGILLLAICYEKPQKMDTDPSYSCEIVDAAGVIDDTDMVQSAIDDFYDVTGIPVEILTVNNEDWQGDNTDGILTASVTNKFNNEMQRDLTARTRYTVSSAISTSFDLITPTVMKTTIRWDLMFFAVVIVAFICLHACLMLGINPKARKYAKAQRCPDTAQEVACEYCGYTYVTGTCTQCPHCGAPVPPQEQSTSPNV